MSVRLKHFTMDLLPKEHKRLSIATSMLGVSKKELILTSIEEFTHRKLNKRTETTLRATDQGKV